MPTTANSRRSSPVAEITQIRTAAETGLAALFDRLKGGLPGDVAVREAALSGFATMGLPHRRVEEFKYTDLRALMRDAAHPAEVPSADETTEAFAEAKSFGELDAARLTFVNGHRAADASGLPAGIEVVAMPDAMASGHPLLSFLNAVAIARGNPIYDLNTAFLADGVVIRVPAGLAVERPIHLRFLAAAMTPFSTATRVLVIVEEGASLTLLESHEGRDGVGYQPNDVLEFVVGDRAKVAHLRLNAEGSESLALSTVTAKLGAEVTFNSLNVVVGGAASRHQVFATFAGEGTNAHIDGANMLKGRQHSDATLVVDHAVPHCTSREMFKSVLDDSSVGVFHGKIIVRPHAQKTDGAMKSNALLLGEGATMNNKPELEIFADDVVCGHGATCGALDADLLFYLKSRGLPEALAQSLLIQAFLGEAVESVEHEGARDALIGVIEGWLAARG